VFDLTRLFHTDTIHRLWRTHLVSSSLIQRNLVASAFQINIFPKTWSHAEPLFAASFLHTYYFKQLHRFIIFHLSAPSFTEVFYSCHITINVHAVRHTSLISQLFTSIWTNERYWVIWFCFKTFKFYALSNQSCAAVIRVYLPGLILVDCSVQIFSAIASLHDLSFSVFSSTELFLQLSNDTSDAYS